MIEIERDYYLKIAVSEVKNLLRSRNYTLVKYRFVATSTNSPNTYAARLTIRIPTESHATIIDLLLSTYTYGSSTC